MKKSTFLVSTAAAISTIAAIGFAYAQSAYTTSPPATSATTPSSDTSTATPAATSTANPDSTGTTSNTATNNMASEPMAQADRN